MKATRSKQPHEGNKEAKPDLAAKVSSEVLEQMQLILELEKQATPTSLIVNTLGVSRSTFYRRKKEMKRILQKHKTGSTETVLEQIAEATAFFKEVRDTGMKFSTASKKERVYGLKIALKAQTQMVRFLFRIGFFEQYKAEQYIKADQMLRDHVNDKQKDTNLRLLDENQMLRENIQALKSGKPEPHDLSNSPDWGTIIEGLSSNADETLETDTEKEDCKMLH